MESYQGIVSQPVPGPIAHRILICVLGTFRLLREGQPVAVRSGGKTETLLSSLAIRYNYGILRETLLQTLWFDSYDSVLAGQALDSLVYSVQKLLGSGTDGNTAVSHVAGCYMLNDAAGVGVDVAQFDALAKAGDHYWRGGSLGEAIVQYERAIDLYRGDLCAGMDVTAVVERERLRAVYLTLLARLADHSYGEGNYASCRDYAIRLLLSDPCREDGHRLVMRCYVRQGERAQALHQYRLCQGILRSEFDVEPEPATVALFEQVRRNPGSV